MGWDVGLNVIAQLMWATVFFFFLALNISIVFFARLLLVAILIKIGC